MDTKTKAIPLPRGIRNNNPGNIRHSSAGWMGKSQTQADSSFVTFDSPEYGIRAMARILMNYQSRYNLESVEEIIERWAPPTENNTRAYVAVVARAAGVKKDDAINLSSNSLLFYRILEAIINHENGSPHPFGRTDWYDQQTILRAIAMTGRQAMKTEDRSPKHSITLTVKVLKRGQRGPEVGMLQKLLIAKGAKIKADNDFGLKTELAVKEFQVKHGLVADGKVGKATRDKLGMSETTNLYLNMLMLKSNTAFV